jgi:enoyl-CoA hydratase
VAFIEHQIIDGVASVTLNNPERRNALTPEMGDELVAVLNAIDSDPTVGALVLSGAGKGFCSGADLRTLEAAGASPLSDEHYGALTAIYAAFTRFGSMSVPTIAAVTGAAVGAGLNLALAADLRIVAEDARLMSGFARISVHPGGGHFHLLARLAGRDTVAAMALFSEEVSGLDAVRLGLAWRALPADEVVPEAQRLAATIADQPGLARALTQSLRLETPGQVSWDAAVAIERAPQLRTFHLKNQ